MHPARHETKTTKLRSNTESTLTTELDSNKTKRFIARGNQDKVGTTEQIWGKSSELGLGVDAIRVKFHETLQLLRGELPVKIDTGPNSNQLDRRVLLEPKRRFVQVTNGEKKSRRVNKRKENFSHRKHNISNQINTLLLRPTADEHKQVRLRVVRDTSPFLRLSLEFRSFRLRLLIDCNVLSRNRLRVQSLDIGGVRIWQGIDVLEGPESGVTSPRPFTVFIRDTSNTDGILVD